MGKAQGGGSGWVLLTWSPRDRKLLNQWAMDHTTTLAGGGPILVLDMYEHSYHMDYGARAAAYVDAFMAAINWPNAGRAYADSPCDLSATERFDSSRCVNLAHRFCAGLGGTALPGAHPNRNPGRGHRPGYHGAGWRARGADRHRARHAARD